MRRSSKESGRARVSRLIGGPWRETVYGPDSLPAITNGEVTLGIIASCGHDLSAICEALNSYPEAAR
jgi:hypothetical protein